MSDSTTLVRSPQQAFWTFSQAGGLPRQRNVFLVRFNINGTQTGAKQQTIRSLSFAAKAIDRPKIDLKTEELNQYNKKRQVYTGFKLSPVRMQFYDSADGAAQNMWLDYVSYYFGDFNPLTNQYNYDITTENFLDAPQGFGFTADNNGSSDPDSQFYFDSVDIFQFYDAKYDQYHLVHPRITNFDPDDLDYENSSIAVISVALAYENLQYYPQRPVIDASQFPEFGIEGPFFGNPVVQSETMPIANGGGVSQVQSSSQPIDQLFSSAQGPLSAPSYYRYASGPSAGPLGIYGNFGFGSPTGYNLQNAAMGNPALGMALSMGGVAAPFGTYGPLAYQNTSRNRSIGSALLDSVMGQVGGALFSGYGTMPSTIASGQYASNAVLGYGRPIMTPTGVVMTPQAYGAMNVNQTGTAQYGYNGAIDDGTF